MSEKVYLYKCVKVSKIFGPKVVSTDWTGIFVSGGKADRTGLSLIGQGFCLDRSKSARTMLEKRKTEKK